MPTARKRPSGDHATPHEAPVGIVAGSASLVKVVPEIEYTARYGEMVLAMAKNFPSGEKSTLVASPGGRDAGFAILVKTFPDRE